MTTLYDGITAAAIREKALSQRVATLKAPPQIAAILFSEDAGSRLYTRKKQEAAGRTGIKYQIHEFSILTPVAKLLETIAQLNADSAVTGIIIQKPWRQIWQSALNKVHSDSFHSNIDQQSYSTWWHSLTDSIAIEKDVDGLHPSLVPAIQQGTWLRDRRVLPATCRAVLHILESADATAAELHRCIIGRSDLLGYPLQAYFLAKGLNSELLGKKDLAARLESDQLLLDADVVISATGVKHLITGGILKQGVVVIDVGEPEPDVLLTSVAPVARFITPVPGGVGPMTVVCLLENSVDML